MYKVYQIEYEIPPMRAILFTTVGAKDVTQAATMFHIDYPDATIRDITDVTE